MTTIKTRFFISIILLTLLATALLACSSDEDNQGVFPTISPTETARPHATATFVNLSFQEETSVVDWDSVDHMYAAMRPEYTSHVDDFVHTRRYYIEAELILGDENAVISGAQRVHFTNTYDHDLSEIVFRLYPNFADMAGQVRVEHLTLNGEPIEAVYTERDTVMSIPLANGLAPNQSVEIGMGFIMVVERGLLPERFGFSSEQFQAFNWHPALSVYNPEEKTWWKNRLYAHHWDPYYGEIGLYEIKLTHSKDVLVGISGVTIDTTENSDNTITEHIVTGPMRDDFMVASPVMGKITDEVDGITVNVYFMPGGERAAEWVMETGIRSLEIFNRLFGDYPYAELDIAQTETNAGGIEYPGIILVDRNVWQNGSPNTELTTAHEVAHQWWYAMVGNNQDEAPFLDEALASFSEGIYLREAYDDNGERYNTWLQGSRDTLNNFTSNMGQDMTMYRPANSFPSSTYVGVLIYTKGRAFYGELAEMLGWDTLISGLRLYFERMQYKITNPNEILLSLEEVSGQPLGGIFLRCVGDFPGLEVTPEELRIAQDSRIFRFCNDVSTTSSSIIPDSPSTENLEVFGG